MYQEIEPSESIAHIVRRYWQLHTEGTERETAQVLPDGCFDIVVDIQTHQNNDVSVTGIWDMPIDVTVKGNVPSVGVQFFPAALGTVINIDISHIKNTTLPLSPDMLKTVKGISFSLLWESGDTEEILAFWEYYLLSLNAEEKSVASCLHTTFAPGLRVADIAGAAFLSSRQLRRIYERKLGLSVKGYQNILRFVRAKEMLLDADIKSLAQIALLLGYSDQAHFSREFKKYAGMTPGGFVAQWKKSVFFNPSD